MDDHPHHFGGTSSVGEIPSFLKHAPVEDEETAEELRKLIHLARVDGYRSAIRSIYGEHRYVTDERRNIVLDVCSISPEDHVLEIGSSLGQMTVELARRAHRVDALEVVYGQAEFTDERCRQEGLANVAVSCGGDDCVLPYEEGRFDGVVVNLVFEWCADRAQGIADHEKGQRQMLSECFRVLRSGGWLFLNTKNRFGIRLLIGRRDEHAFGIRFGNALPRWLMTQIMGTRNHTGPRGLLHSYSSFNKMIRQAGFECLKTYWLVPDMRYPQYVVPLEKPAIREMSRRKHEIQNEGRTYRWLRKHVPEFLIKYVTPGLCTVARRRQESAVVGR